jgi:predicted RNA binding protein with dsRBD fold (UPF0201 family)
VARSIGFDVIKRDRAVINAMAAKTKIISLLVELLIELQIITGARRRKMTKGVRSTRVALLVKPLEKT